MLGPWQSAKAELAHLPPQWGDLPTRADTSAFLTYRPIAARKIIARKIIACPVAKTGAGAGHPSV
jgi:hypothetical protein